MEFKITNAGLMERPQVTLPDVFILKELKESGVRDLISAHYDFLVQSKIKHLFPPTAHGLERAKKNSADFFVQILGGKPYFNENRGKPMMIRRHMPFKITPEARIVWLECFRDALLLQDLPESLMESFWNYIETFSKWMINTES